MIQGVKDGNSEATTDDGQRCVFIFNRHALKDVLLFFNQSKNTNL